MEKYLISMPDNSTWSIPVSIIAKNRAEHYAKEFEGNVDKSLIEDTLPLFLDDEYEIEDWARNNMNWSDVMPFAEVFCRKDVDYQEGWLNGDCEIK